MKRAGRWLFNFAAVVSLTISLAMVFVYLNARGNAYVTTRFLAWRWKLIVGTASQRGAGLWVVQDWPGKESDRISRNDPRIPQPYRRVMTEFGDRARDRLDVSIPYDLTPSGNPAVGAITAQLRVRPPGFPTAKDTSFLGVHYASVPLEVVQVVKAGEDHPAPGQRFHPVSSIASSWPLLMVLPCILPTTWVGLLMRSWRQARERKRLRLCLTCGYDLRATPDRCPECGAVPEGAKGAAT